MNAWMVKRIINSFWIQTFFFVRCFVLTFLTFSVSTNDFIETRNGYKSHKLLRQYQRWEWKRSIFTCFVWVLHVIVDWFVDYQNKERNETKTKNCNSELWAKFLFFLLVVSHRRIGATFPLCSLLTRILLLKPHQSRVRLLQFEWMTHAHKKYSN